MLKLKVLILSGIAQLTPEDEHKKNQKARSTDKSNQQDRTESILL